MTTATRANKRICQAWRQPVWHMFLLCGPLFLLSGSKTSAGPSVFRNTCYESYHLLVRMFSKTSAGPSVFINSCPSVFVNICYESYHLLQKQLLLLTMEPSAGHVIKYYKRVLAIRYIAVGIKKLLKTNKFEIIVRRGGSLVASVPSGSNSTLDTTKGP